MRIVRSSLESIFDILLSKWVFMKKQYKKLNTKERIFSKVVLNNCGKPPRFWNYHYELKIHSMYFVVVIIVVHCYSSQSTIYSSFIFNRECEMILKPIMHYVYYVGVFICKTCEFSHYPSQSFVCRRKSVTKDLGILDIKTLEILKIIIFVKASWKTIVF
jgi:hypothetical protein